MYHKYVCMPVKVIPCTGSCAAEQTAKGRVSQFLQRQGVNWRFVSFWPEWCIVSFCIAIIFNTSLWNLEHVASIMDWDTGAKFCLHRSFHESF